MIASEYVTHLWQLSRYAPNNIDTDDKKSEYILNGLNDGLSYTLEARDFLNYQAMVNKALVLGNIRGILKHKHIQGHQSQYGNNYKPHFGVLPPRPIFCPTQHNFQ
jgi:hypothetical protein